MRKWQVQEAKARFSAFLDVSLAEGPQIVTKRGKEAAVLLEIEEWRRLQASAKPSLKDVLLSDEARADVPIPPRSRWRRRLPEAFG